MKSQGKHHMKLKAEIGVMNLQARNTKDSANQQKLGERCGAASSLEPLGGTDPANSLVSEFQLPDWEAMNFFCLNLIVCDTFPILGNKYRNNAHQRRDHRLSYLITNICPTRIGVRFMC